MKERRNGETSALLAAWKINNRTAQYLSCKHKFIAAILWIFENEYEFLVLINLVSVHHWYFWLQWGWLSSQASNGAFFLSSNKFVIKRYLICNYGQSKSLFVYSITLSCIGWNAFLLIYMMDKYNSNTNYLLLVFRLWI